MGDDPIIREILEIPGNRLAIAKLLEALNSPAGVGAFVGPQFGQELGYQVWEQFIAGLAGEPCSDSATAEVLEQRIKQRMGEMFFNDALAAEYGIHRSKPIEPGGPLLLIPFVARGPFVDAAAHQLLERTLYLAGVNVLVRSAGRVLWTNSVTWNSIRLYGYADQPDTRPLSDGAWIALDDFRNAATNTTFLFLGCGPGDWAKLPVALSGDARAHYVITSAPDRPNVAKSMAERHIRAIRIPERLDRKAPEPLDLLLRYLSTQIKPEFRPLGAKKLPGADRAGDAAPAVRPPGWKVMVEHTPDMPRELIDACQSGRCVLVTGFGLSMRAGAASRAQFLEGLLNSAVGAGQINRESEAVQREALAIGELDAVADNLSSVLEPAAIAAHTMEVDRASARSKLSVLMQSPENWPKTFQTLARIPFAGVINSSFDTSVDRVFTARHGDALTPDDTERLKEAVTQNRPFLLRLFGDPRRPQTLTISQGAYRSRIGNNLPFGQFIEGLFYSHVLLFLGMSIDRVNEILRDFSIRSPAQHKHYALVAAAGAGWKARAESMIRRFQVEVLAFPEAPGYPHVDQALDQLADRSATGQFAVPGAHAPEAAPPVSRIRKLTIENIGPFERLDLEFGENWKVLLGDNGVGKSSILKSLAVGIAGNEASVFATHLLRVDQTSGRITIVTDKNPSGYVTEILRQSTPIPLIRSVTARLLDAEGPLALGFPPMRIVDDRRAQGPQTLGKASPNPEDLLPILKREADPRTDKLKQWIVNLDHLRKTDTSGRPWGKILDRFFEIVGQLTRGVGVRFREVTPHFEVLVESGDVAVPISALSQGTTSLLSWVGVLTQRLYEIHDFADDSLSRYGLVLIDEIDAHMHPDWQQRIVPSLKELFPNVQFLASTHSPLIVGGMKVEEVTRLVRDANGRVQIAELEQEMLLGRADQVLTSGLFQLKTTLDVETQNRMAEYKKLLGKRKRTESEEARFRELERVLNERIPSTPETPEQRGSHDLSQKILDVLAQPQIGETERHMLRTLAAKLARMTEDASA